MNLPALLSGAASVGILLGAAIVIAKSRRSEQTTRLELQAREATLRRQAYEAEIMRELGERFGYELDEEKIVDVISNSIGKLFSFATVASLLVTESGIKFKIHLEESVSETFITKVRDSLLAALEVLEGAKVRELPLTEQRSGTIINAGDPRLPGSFFNIPIVIDQKLSGILNIASTPPGLYQEEEMTILYRIVAQASTAVTKLRQVLATEKGKLSAMVESLSDGVIMLDNETRVMVINPAAKQALRLSDPEPSIFAVLEAFGTKLRLREIVAKANTSDRLIVVEEVNLGDRILKVFVIPVKDKLGNRIGTAALLHDISKEKELERLREDFTAMMVHELRTPLTAVRGASNALQKHEAEFSKEKQREYLQMIEGSADQMIAIVNDLLDVAKIEAGKFQVNKEPTEMTEVIRLKTEEFRPLVQEKHLELTTDIPQGKMTLEVDPTRIGQVLANLLSNAIKFTEQGKVEVSLKESNREVVVAIRDTGPGIAEEDRGRLFSKFGQLEKKSTRTAQGTGLGLVIAKGIVEAHGGRIWLESEVGRGSTFFVGLPKGKG